MFCVAMVGIAFVIDGAVIIEAVFSWPGMGKLLIDAIQSRNLPVALATFFGLGIIVVETDSSADQRDEPTLAETGPMQATAFTKAGGT